MDSKTKQPPTADELAAKCIKRCDIISGFTESEGNITRRFLTDPMVPSHETLRAWLQELNMTVRVDNAGNIIGRRPSGAGGKTLMIGSHIDTVLCGGKYDGLLGVMVALAAVEMIGACDFPVNVDVAGFSEEEGVRFAQPYLGSHAIAGTFDMTWLDRVDEDGISMRSAIKSFGLNPEEIDSASYPQEDLVAFVEPHICLLYTSPSPRDATLSRMPSSA